MKTWPADSVERRSVASLVPYARNSRTHSDEQVTQIAASIQEWGWTMPVLVGEDGTIIAGHGRVMAAQRLGLVDVPCMVARGWTDAQRRAYVIADNKLALSAEWDYELLRTELADLKGLDFDLELTGFHEKELDALLLQSAFEELSDESAPESSTKEIDVDVYEMDCQCPRCGFEFNNPKA
jgi:ParB-like chromosome segregation protein Spo0J